MPTLPRGRGNTAAPLVSQRHGFSAFAGRMWYSGLACFFNSAKYRGTSRPIFA